MGYTPQLPGPLWQRLLALGAILSGGGVFFATMVILAPSGNPADEGAVGTLSGVLFVIGLLLVGISVVVKRYNPEEHRWAR